MRFGHYFGVITIDGGSELILAGVVVAALVVGILLRRRPHPSTRPISPRFTPHAVSRMAERRVRERDVESVLARPDRAIPTTYTDLGGEPEQRDSVRLERDFPGRMLKVWVPTDWRSQDPVVVKSVAWQYVTVFRIPRAQIGSVIGRAGQTVQNLEQTYDVRINVERRTEWVHIVGDDQAAVASARKRIRRLSG